MAVFVAQIVVALGSGLWIALILLGLPGTWLALATAALCEWLTAPQLFSHTTWIAAVSLAVAGELWEFLASSVGARRAGAGKKASMGALAGGILGALLGTFLIPVPLLGSLIGGGIGAFALSSYLEHEDGRELRQALHIGRAAALGHVLGMVGKLAAGVTVWVVLALAVVLP